MSGTLNAGWTTASLGDIAAINPRHARTFKDSMVVSFAPMAAVSESKPAFNYLDERELGKVRQGFTHFADGDVLFAKITPCMENGKGAVAAGLRNGLGCGTTELIVIRPLGGVDAHYVYRFLSQRSIREEAKEHFTGTAGQARVPTSFVEDLEIPLAPLSEQRRIVARLETFITKVHASRVRLDQVKRVLERFRQAVLAAASDGNLTADWRTANSQLEAVVPPPPQGRPREGRRGANLSGPTALLIEEMPDLPQSWRYVRHDWLASPGTVICYGIVLPGPEVSRGVPYVRQQDIQDGRIRINELRHTTREIAARHGRSSLAEGDVLLCIIRNLRVAIVPKELAGANITQGSVRIRPDQRYVSGHYLAAYLASPSAQAWMRRRYFGMDMPRINVEDARALPIALPPIEEQLEIVRRLKRLLSVADMVEKRLGRASDTIERASQAVMAKAFRGELVATEAELARREGREYESASALLERIHRERTRPAEHAKNEKVLHSRGSLNGRRRKVG